MKLISAVVPISKMQGRFSNLKFWLKQIDFNIMEIILVHDIQDNVTSEELKTILMDYELEILKHNLFIFEKYCGSPGFARNCGLDLATGKWIVFWDSDDLPNIPEYIKIARENPEGIDLIIGQFAVSEIGSSSKSTSRFEHKTLNEVAFNPGIWRMIFSRASIDTNLRFEKFLMGEDQLFIANYFKTQPEIYFTKVTFYTYFTGGTLQLTSNQKAILDLKQTISASKFVVKELQEPYKQFAVICTIRQIITLLSDGTVITKFWAIKELIFFTVKYARKQRTISLLLKFYLKRIGFLA